MSLSVNVTMGWWQLDLNCSAVNVRDCDVVEVMRYLLDVMLDTNCLAGLAVGIQCRASWVEGDGVRQRDLHVMAVNHSCHSARFVDNSFRLMANFLVASLLQHPPSSMDWPHTIATNPFVHNVLHMRADRLHNYLQRNTPNRRPFDASTLFYRNERKKKHNRIIVKSINNNQ